MRFKTPILVALVVVALGVGVRLGVRELFREEYVHHSATHPCGAVLWSTDTTSRTSPADEAPFVESTSVVHVNGALVEVDVEEVRCSYEDDFAAVVSRTSPKEIHVYGKTSGVLARTVAFDDVIASTGWSRRGERVAALLRPAGRPPRLAVVTPAAGAAHEEVVREDARLGPGFRWSDGGDLCWVLASKDEAELECWSPGGRVRFVARAARAPGSGVPWVGLQGEAAHLCGSGLEPRDVECAGLHAE